MSGMPGMPGMPGMGGVRGVDPYLPCSSRHFLRQQVRNATSQGAQVEVCSLKCEFNMKSICTCLYKLCLKYIHIIECMF